MFVREVVAVVHSSDTSCLGSGFANKTVIQKLVTVTDLEFDSSYFRSRAGIIKRIQVTKKLSQEKSRKKVRFVFPFYLHIF
jgi:hypothetical protein